MKDFLVKYLFLSYRAKIFGMKFTFLRAISFIVPVFCIAIILTMLFDHSWIAWIVFGLLILLTFPILKENWINYSAAIIVPLMIGGSHYFGYEWWEPLPLFYFALGIFVKRTKFLFLSVRYEDLMDWQQQLQYLRIPTEQKSYDETEPVGVTRMKTIRNLEELEEIKYNIHNNINVLVLLIPFLSVLATIAILIILNEGIERFPDRRFF